MRRRRTDASVVGTRWRRELLVIHVGVKYAGVHVGSGSAPSRRFQRRNLQRCWLICGCREGWRKQTRLPGPRPSRPLLDRRLQHRWDEGAAACSADTPRLERVLLVARREQARREGRCNRGGARRRPEPHCCARDTKDEHRSRALVAEEQRARLHSQHEDDLCWSRGLGCWRYWGAPPAPNATHQPELVRHNGRLVAGWKAAALPSGDV
jgi:hypothetical protein